MQAFKIKCQMLNLTAFIKAKLNGLSFRSKEVSFPTYIANDEVFIKLKSPSKMEMVSLSPEATFVKKLECKFVSNYYKWLVNDKLEYFGFAEIAESQYTAAKLKVAK